MHTHDALDRVIRAYPGGYDAMAQRLAKHASTLRNEVNPPIGSSAKLGWDTALQIMSFCRQLGMPEALAPLDAAELEHGRVAYAMPTADDVGDDALERITGGAKAFADMVGTFTAAVSDGQVTGNENRGIRRCGLALIGQVQGIVAYAEAMHAAAQPAHLREVA